MYDYIYVVLLCESFKKTLSLKGTNSNEKYALFSLVFPSFLPGILMRWLGNSAVMLNYEAVLKMGIKCRMMPL